MMIRSFSIFAALSCSCYNRQTDVAALSVDPIIHLGVGAVAGGCGAIAYQPFDYIKAQIQSDKGGQLYQNNGLTCLAKTLKRDPRKLWGGMTAAVMGVAPEKSLKLGVNDVLRDVFTSYGGFPLWSQVVSGAVAGACQVLVASPLDAIKIRMQTRESELDGPLIEKPSLGQLLEEIGGPTGLYRGVGACLLRDISFTALCFPLYNRLLESGMNVFVAGALSGSISTFIATPFDMVKTRILTNFAHTGKDVNALSQGSTEPQFHVQVQKNGGGILSMPYNNTFGGFEWIVDDLSNEEVRTSKEKRQANAFQVAKDIVDQEGAGVLLSGVYERCIGAIPRFGITLGAHEYLEHYVRSVGLLS